MYVVEEIYSTQVLGQVSVHNDILSKQISHDGGEVKDFGRSMVWMNAKSKAS